MKSFHRAAKKKQYRGIGKTHEPYNLGTLCISPRSNDRVEKISPFGSTGGPHGPSLFEDRSRLLQHHLEMPPALRDHKSDHLIEGVRLAIEASS